MSGAGLSHAPPIKSRDIGVENILEGLPTNVQKELVGFSENDLLGLTKDDCVDICRSRSQGIRLYRRINPVSPQARQQEESRQIQDNLNENVLLNGNSNEGERNKENERKKGINESESANGGGRVETGELGPFDMIDLNLSPSNKIDIPPFVGDEEFNSHDGSLSPSLQLYGPIPNGKFNAEKNTEIGGVSVDENVREMRGGDNPNPPIFRGELLSAATGREQVNSSNGINLSSSKDLSSSRSITAYNGRTKDVNNYPWESNDMKYEQILTLEPGKFKKVVLRVSRRIKDTAFHHGKKIEFDEPGLLVSFSRFDDLGQVLKKIGKDIVYICGKIILRSNRPINRVELLNKQGQSLKGKIYPSLLYPTDMSSSSSSSNTSSSVLNSQLVLTEAEGKTENAVRGIDDASKSLFSSMPKNDENYTLSASPSPNLTSSQPIGVNKDQNPEIPKRAELRFSIHFLAAKKYDIENYAKGLLEAGEFMKKVFGVIPKEFRDEDAERKAGAIGEVSENVQKIKVSLKLMKLTAPNFKAEYCWENVSRIWKNAVELWKRTNNLPKGVRKGESPIVTEGCIKITQFFKMRAEAKASEMLEWIFDKKRHLMSTLTFNGEAVTEPDIEYISANQANKSGIPNKIKKTYISNNVEFPFQPPVFPIFPTPIPTNAVQARRKKEQAIQAQKEALLRVEKKLVAEKGDMDTTTHRPEKADNASILEKILMQLTTLNMEEELHLSKRSTSQAIIQKAEKILYGDARKASKAEIQKPGGHIGEDTQMDAVRRELLSLIAKVKNENLEHSSSSSKLLGKRNRSEQDALSLDQQKQKLLQTENKTNRYRVIKIYPRRRLNVTQRYHQVVGGDHIVVIKGLIPDDYKDVRNNNTYLWINGEHRIKDIVQVFKPIQSKHVVKYDYDETVELHGDADEKLAVRFLRSDNGTVQRITHKRKESATIHLSGEIILKSNFPIEKLELLDEDMKPIKNKKYKWLLYDEPWKRQQRQHPLDSTSFAKFDSSWKLSKRVKLSPKLSSKVKPQIAEYVRKTEKHHIKNVDNSMKTETTQKSAIRVNKEPGIN
eukprot:jgi/Bigna1/91773/estExt_fgenesh1_pg.C_1180018